MLSTIPKQFLAEVYGCRIYLSKVKFFEENSFL